MIDDKKTTFAGDTIDSLIKRVAEVERERDEAQAQLGHFAMRLEGIIRGKERERDAAVAEQRKLEEQLRYNRASNVTRNERDAAVREANWQREQSHERLVAALRAGAKDLTPLIETVENAIDHELDWIGDDWSNLDRDQKRHVAANVVQSIAVDLAGEAHDGV